MSKTKPRKMNWPKMINEIVELDPAAKWTYASIGDRVGTSRSTIGRLMTEPGLKHHLDEPKWSQGMALIELHTEVKEKHKINQLKEAK